MCALVFLFVMFMRTKLLQAGNFGALLYKFRSLFMVAPIYLSFLIAIRGSFMLFVRMSFIYELYIYTERERERNRERETERARARERETRTYMHTCIHEYMHACIHAYIHAYIHTHGEKERVRLLMHCIGVCRVVSAYPHLCMVCSVYMTNMHRW
jgi:hypothetical protein